MEGYFTFQWGASFLSGGRGVPQGISFDGGGVSKKIVGWGLPPPHAPLPLWETLKPFIKNGLLEEME